MNFPNLLFDDRFLIPERWGTKLIDDWFVPGAKMNGVTIQPSYTQLGPTGLILNTDAAGGAVVSSNPAGGASPGVTFGYARVVYDAYFDGRGWSALWTTGQSWPATGENDIAEWLGAPNGSMFSPYHSGGYHMLATDMPNNGPSLGQWAGGWHRFRLDRMPDLNVIYYDGIEQRRYQTFDGGAPHYLVMSNTGPVSSTLRVRRVRVWTP